MNADTTVHMNILSVLSRSKHDLVLNTLETDKDTSNCYGTAAYITGIQKKDAYLSEEEFAGLVKKHMVRIPRPVSLSMILFENEFYENNVYITHAGIVLKRDPLLVFSRRGYKADCMACGLNDLDIYHRTRIGYYVPKKK